MRCTTLDFVTSEFVDKNMMISLKKFVTAVNQRCRKVFTILLFIQNVDRIVHSVFRTHYYGMKLHYRQLRDSCHHIYAD